jgi:hypothetical protein
MDLLKLYQEVRQQLGDMGLLESQSTPNQPSQSAPPPQSTPFGGTGLDALGTTEEFVVLDGDWVMKKQTDSALGPNGVPLSRQTLSRRVASGCWHLPDGKEIRIVGRCICGKLQCNICHEQCEYCGAPTGFCCRGFLDGRVICSHCEARISTRIKRTARWLGNRKNRNTPKGDT